MNICTRPKFSLVPIISTFSFVILKFLSSQSNSRLVTYYLFVFHPVGVRSVPNLGKRFIIVKPTVFDVYTFFITVGVFQGTANITLNTPLNEKKEYVVRALYPKEVNEHPGTFMKL